MELTANLRKMVASLDAAKSRRQMNMFKAEGTKCVMDTIYAFNIQYIFCLAEWWEQYGNNIAITIEPIIVKRADMERMTGLSTPAPVIAVYEIPERQFDMKKLSGHLTLALDTIQDPGNLGTIVRAADWFGVNNIICNHNTADIFNSKSVMATMGAISRVNVFYCELAEVLAKADIPIYGTFLDGENIYEATLTKSGIIIMGNEGQGISSSVAKYVNRRLLIPPFPLGNQTSESLNVGVATAITLSEFRRRCNC